MPTARHVHIGNLTLGNDRPLALIAGRRMEINLRAEIATFERTMTLRIIAIVGTLHAMLFALLKLT